jgi:hypothetical protein
VIVSASESSNSCPTTSHILAEYPGSLLLREVDHVDPARWGELASNDPESTSLHRPAVNRILAEGIRGARPIWLEVVDEQGVLRAGLPLIERRRFGLRHIVSGASGLYGGPVVDGRESGAARLLADRFTKSSGLLTFRRELVWSGCTQPEGEWEGIRPLPTSVLLTSPDSDFDEWYEGQLKSSRRKERRRLGVLGYRVASEKASAFIRDFHAVYRERCREWGAVPVPELTLEALLDLGPEWMAFVARDADGSLIGAHVCVDLGAELFAWLGTARRVEGGSVATLLIEAELRWCHDHGRRALNLGTSSNLAGVSDFKRGISAVEDPRWIVRWQRGRGYV